MGTRILSRILSLAVLLFGTTVACAQAFPSKPLTLIVPFGAGSGTDTSARLYARGLEEALRQSVIVENKPGAAGTIGVETVAKSAPDGHTMLFLGGGSISRTFRKELPADLLVDLAPVIQLTRGALFLLVKSELANTAQEFIELVRRNPGKYNYASIASTQMMPMEVLKDRAKIQIAHVPYKSGGQLVQGLLSGDVIAIAGSSIGLEAQFDAGKLRLLAYLDDTRNPLYPDVPASPEVGLAGVKAPFTQGVWVPAKTPAAAITVLNAAFNGVLKRPEIRELHRRQGGIITGGAPRVQSDAVRAEHAYWAAAAKISGFQPE